MNFLECEFEYVPSHNVINKETHQMIRIPAFWKIRDEEGNYKTMTTNQVIKKFKLTI